MQNNFDECKSHRNSYEFIEITYKNHFLHFRWFFQVIIRNFDYSKNHHFYHYKKKYGSTKIISILCSQKKYQYFRISMIFSSKLSKIHWKYNFDEIGVNFDDCPISSNLFWVLFSIIFWYILYDKSAIFFFII